MLSRAPLSFHTDGSGSYNGSFPANRENSDRSSVRRADKEERSSGMDGG
jgi:hypothetical protein